VTAGRTTWFPGMATTARWHGPNGGDDRADGAVPGRGDDGIGGGQGGCGVVPIALEVFGVAAA
jgi:hypothetical protein